MRIKEKTPILQTSGVITYKKEGLWYHLCKFWSSDELAELANETCINLGKKGYRTVALIPLESLPLNEDYIYDFERRSQRQSEEESVQHNSTVGLESTKELLNTQALVRTTREQPSCKRAYVECNKMTTGYFDSFSSKSGYEVPPWIAAIYIDNVYKCTGALISVKWILTSAHCSTSLLE